MITVLRLTVAGDLPYSPARILVDGERDIVPNFFEDSNFVFVADGYTHSTQYLNVSFIQLDNTFRKDESYIRVRRVSVNSDMSFENVLVIPPYEYDRHGIPIVFPIADQFTFTDKHGTYITSDYQVTLVEFLR